MAFFWQNVYNVQIMSAENSSEEYINDALGDVMQKPTRERIQWAALALRDVVIHERELKVKQLEQFEMYTAIITDPRQGLFVVNEYELTELEKAEIAIVGVVDAVQVTHCLKPRHARKALALSRRA